jgi:hypothetical protein
MDMLCSLIIVLSMDGRMDKKPRINLLMWLSNGEIADLREKYELLVVMRDLAGENMSQEIQELFTEKVVKSYFTTPYEP